MGTSDILVAGAGGFIGGHLARSLIEMGASVRGVDIKPLHDWHQIPPGGCNPTHCGRNDEHDSISAAGTTPSFTTLWSW